MAVMTTDVAEAPPGSSRRLAELERGIGPFEDPHWRAGLALLAGSLQAVSLSWLADCRTIVALADRVPRSPGDERGGTPWTSFVREVAVAKKISDRAAHAEIALARGLVERHPCTVQAVSSGVAPAARARLLVELCAGLPAAVAAVADRLLAERLGALPPWRLKQEVELLWLRLDPDGAARREAVATADRSASRCSLPDAQGEVVLTGPAPLVQRWWEALTAQARALKAAGDQRSLAALRFDLAVHTDPRGLTGYDDLSAGVGIATPTGGSAAPTGGSAAWPTDGPAAPTGGSAAWPTSGPAGTTTGGPAGTTGSPGGAAGAASGDATADPVLVDSAIAPTATPAADPTAGAQAGPEPADRPGTPGIGAPSGLGLGVRVREDARCSRPVQASITVPAATALGLSDEPGWLDGHGWISAPLSRRLLTVAELRKACVAPHSGQLIDLADRLERPRTVATAIRQAVRRMVLTPHQLRTTVTDTQPQHDPNPALRRFVQARDRWCDGPTGTQLPAARTDIDHDHPWPAGPTAAWNLISRAGRTHQLKHFGWAAERDSRGTTWTSPAGRVVLVPRPEHPPPPPQHPLPDPDALAAHDAALTHAHPPGHDAEDQQDLDPEGHPRDGATAAGGPADAGGQARRAGPLSWPDDPPF